ncbi:MAG: type II secretion system protein, partial [Ketobacteraceae bacterium]|nr:type II secretion system protein [Ketobacteraceae bacterium]
MQFKSMQSHKNRKGFTLVELITVVAIVSLLVVYITIKLGSSNEDAKVALASTFILGNVPTAISSYKARHMNSCTALTDFNDDTDGDAVREELIKRGLVRTTPWNEDWSARYINRDRLVQIIMPLAGSEDPDGSARDVAQNIFDAPQIDGLAIISGVGAAEYSQNQLND